MKKIFILSFAIISLNTHAMSFKPHYEDFVSNGTQVYGEKEIKIKKRFGPRRSKNVRGVSFYVDGIIASCGGLKLRELFPKIKVKVLSCDKYNMELSIKYLRVSACDQGMWHDNKKLKITIPKGCNYSVKEGVINILND